MATAVLVLGAVSVSVTTQDRPDRVSGIITRTFSIVANTELGGDITCAVADGTPCFSFTVPGLELRLNGYTVTGKGDPVTGCGGAVTTGEVGITTTADPYHCRHLWRPNHYAFRWGLQEGVREDLKARASLADVARA